SHARASDADWRYPTNGCNIRLTRSSRASPKTTSHNLIATISWEKGPWSLALVPPHFVVRSGRAAMSYTVEVSSSTSHPERVHVKKQYRNQGCCPFCRDGLRVLTRRFSPVKEAGRSVIHLEGISYLHCIPSGANSRSIVPPSS